MSRKKVNNKILICPQCNKEFTVKEYSNRIYCSDKCSREHWKGSHNKSILSNCVICNKEFYRLPSRIKDNKDKCCSRKCAIELMKKTSYLVTRSNEQAKKDTEKSRKTNSGINHYWWKGGITPLRLQIYRSNIFRNWRNEVFKRDNWICQECGTRGGKLEAHHLKSFSDIIADNGIKTLEDALACKELGDISNGITLCEGCHKLTENYGWKQYHRNKNNTQKEGLE